MPKYFSPDQCHGLLTKGSRVWLQECSAASPALHGIIRAAPGPQGLSIFGVFVPGLNRVAHLAGDGRRVETILAAPDLSILPPDESVFHPFNYREMWRVLDRSPPDAALFAVSPPDASGMCSFGTVCDVLPLLWPRIPVRIAQINPAMPRTSGAPGIPYGKLTAVIEVETPLPEMLMQPDLLAERAGQHLASFVPDGAWLQVGLGRMPEGVLRGLHGHKGLRIHSGLIGDAVLDLLEAGALAPGAAINAGVAIGSRRLYDAVSGAAFRFRPISYTHDRARMAALGDFVTINSAMQVDLFGQVFSEVARSRFVSGAGGGPDFSAGAALASGGLRVIVLPASRGAGWPGIALPGHTEGPVTLSRHDVDVIITEHGAADLRGLSHRARAEALISIAAPQDRIELTEGMRKMLGCTVSAIT